MEKHWSEKISGDEAEFYLRWMLVGERYAQKETDAIVKLFSEMNVKPEMKILDFCCGYGRHTVRLAEKGFRVTALDLSEANIRYAKKFAEERNVSSLVDFLVGDTLKIRDALGPHRGEFDGIIGILPAIGYYDEKTDENVLAQLAQIARSEGVLILNVANRDYHMERFKFSKERVVGSPSYEVHHEYNFNYEKSRMADTWKIYEIVDQDLRHLSTVTVDRRLYSLHELIELYRRSSWTYVKSFGSYQLEPLNAEKPMIIAIGKKG